jgi:hypothetical protein
MIAALLGLLDFLKAFPVFRPLRHFPSVVALKDWDHVLARDVQNLAQRFDRGFTGQREQPTSYMAGYGWLYG